MHHLEAVLLTCRTHGLARALVPEDQHFRDSARDFFLTHGDCETSIDLDGQSLRGWAVPT